MEKEKILLKVDRLIEKGLATAKSSVGYVENLHAQSHPYNNFKAASLTFLANLAGVDSEYYQQFAKTVSSTHVNCVSGGIGILRSLKEDIEEGWLTTYKEIVTAEIFSDFLEMSEHLLEQGYKDPAAVMIGSVLEEHLRQLCLKNNIEITTNKDGKDLPKRSDTLNSELKKQNVYNTLEQKHITAWLDLRNKAAHGNYMEYTKEQVQSMWQAVSDFIVRHP